MTQSQLLGIDLGGSKILAAVFAADGSVIASTKKKTKPDIGYDGLQERILAVAAEAAEAAGTALDAFPVIGMGVPGPVDASGRVLANATNLGWGRTALAEDLERRLPGQRLVLANDVNAGALGETTWGAAAGAESAYAAFMGTGLGGAYVLAGQPVNGVAGFAGEIGHMRGPFDEAPCNCGQRGCLETVASKIGLQRMIAMEIGAGRTCLLEKPSRLKSSDLRQAWDRECPVTRACLIRAARAMGWGLAVVQAVLNPEVLILGGGVFAALGAELKAEVDAVMAEQVFFAEAGASVKLAQLGDYAVAAGAAVAARALVGQGAA
jgi:glucokinase